MEAAPVPVPAPAPVIFEDGLGERHRVTDRARNEPVEILCLRPELTAVPAFEFALRERVSHLAAFRHACYGRVRSVERLKPPASSLALVSDITAGLRLSELLAFADRAQVTLDIDAALWLLRQLVPAVAMLHEHAPDIAHAAISPERLVVTPGARIIVVEHVLGSAVGELKFSADRYWKDLRIALPASSPAGKFDHRSDVMQIAVVAVALILGRRLADDETPARLGDVVASSWGTSAQGALEPLPAGLKAWLITALQLDPRKQFESAVDAQQELERVLEESDYIAAPTTLEAFLAKYRAAHDGAAGRGDAAAMRQAGPVRQIQPQAPQVAKPAEQAVRPSAATPMPAPPRVAAVRPPDILHRPSLDTPVRQEALGIEHPAADLRRDQREAAAPVAPQPLKRAEPAAAAVHTAPILRDDAPFTLPPSGVRHQPLDAHDQDEDMTFGKPERTKRARWPLAAAAIVVLGVAGAGVPVARRYMTPATAPAEGTLTMTTMPPGARLFVDGVDRGATPLTVTLNPGPHALELRGGGAPRLLPITITAGAQVSQYLELPTAAATSGQLLVRTEPAGARVSIDGVPRGTAPLTIPDLAAGDHIVAVESDLGSVKQTVTIEGGNTASLLVPLATPEAVHASGWIAVSAPADVQLFESGRLLGTSQSDRLMVAAGRHDIEIVNEPLGYRATRTLQVAPGKTTPIKVDFPKGAIALNATPWAEVWADGEKVGDTPIGNLELAIGPHEFVFRHPELGEQRHAAMITLKAPARLSVDMRKK